MTACWRRRLRSTCRSISIRIWRRRRCAQAYYSGLEQGAGRVLEAAGWGWHSETAIHVLRMVLAGTLDKHPKLKIIIGHMGEMLPVMLARIDAVVRARYRPPQRPISRAILDQVWITTSGIFTEPPLPGRAADLRHRPHHVLGRLPLRAQYGRPPISQPRFAFADRYGQARARQCGRAAEAEGLGPNPALQRSEIPVIRLSLALEWPVWLAPCMGHWL